MRKLPVSLFVALFSFGHLWGQLNMRLLSNISYPGAEGNDIWGYVAPDGTEYALMGLTSGISIVSLADPENAREVAFVEGAHSIWRDIKTYGHFAYVTADQPGTKEGLLIINLADLPNRVTVSRWRYVFAEGDTLFTCHNLYIDEYGIAYLAGCNYNRGGVIFADVASQPGQPAFAGLGPAIYAHDVYVRNNIMYTSDILQGQLSIYDVARKSEIRLLGATPTPYRFTHNAWLSDDGKTIFTTDERANAPTTAFDISRLDNIRELDQYRPAATLGRGVIPHNVHVRENWLAISHYTDGVRMVDATRPNNLVEVGYYDTYPGPDGGFRGAWGVYPNLPSGTILVSDINSGLYVLSFDYVRAAYLEGRVSARGSNAAIPNVTVRIVSAQANIAQTDPGGDYRAGLAAGGTYEVIFSHPEYRTLRANATLVNGELTILDVQLTPKDLYRVSGHAVSAANGLAVPQAQVLVTNDDFTYMAIADENGRFSLDQVFEGYYDIYAGAWGFLHRKLESVRIENSASLTITLQKGYQDDFLFDLGWIATGDARRGHWERGIPDGVRSSVGFTSPPADVPDDYGEECYVTGNGGGNPRNDDVSDGTVILSSPPMDLSGYQAPVISYYLWFFNGLGSTPPDDELLVFLTNGVDTVLLERVTESRSAWRERSLIPIEGLIELNDNMRVIFHTSDFAETPHVVEAAVDAFLVEQSTPRREPASPATHLRVFPNPFDQQVWVEYELRDGAGAGAMLQIFNLLGQEVERIPLNDRAGTISAGHKLAPGAYALRIVVGKQGGPALRIIKQATP
jgi:choice-of-anchor B domain-containing protein